MKVVGIDIGGTFVKAGLLGEDLRVLEETSWPTPRREGPEALVAQIGERYAAWNGRKRSRGKGAEPARLGIACAGLVERGTGAVRSSPNLPLWKNVTLAVLVERELGFPVTVLNDANAFALAETRLGAGRGRETVVGITLGTGVGGGLILDGRLWEGRRGFAGEIGHMKVQVDGPRCSCGGRGCLEALIGTPAILDRYRSLAGGAAEPRDADLTPKEIALRAGRGDDAAVRTYQETGRLLGLALAGLTYLLDPDLFVIGGGVAKAGELLFPAARQAMSAELMLEGPVIAPAALGGSAGWIGAAFGAREGGSGPARP